MGTTAPNGQAGTLTVVDQRTGLAYELQICKRGSLKTSDFSKIRAGGDGKGLKLYDPGFVHTAPVESCISSVDGTNGTLRYRGHLIDDLLKNCTFLEVTYLLSYGVLPSKSQMSTLEVAIENSVIEEELLAILNSLPEHVHPMKKFVTVLYSLSSFFPDANPLLAGQNIYKLEASQHLQICRIMGKMVNLAGAIFSGGKALERPNNSLSFAEMILYIFHSRGNKDYIPDPKLATILDKTFIIVAEHELGPSTAAALHFSSSGVDVYTAMAGAASAASGPIEAGAVEETLNVLKDIATVEGIEEFLQQAKIRGSKVPGFGHRRYKTQDPRAKLIQELTQEVHNIMGHDPLVEVADALENAILSDDYFKNKKICANVAFRLCILFRAFAFPQEFFGILCAIARTAGHLAHWKEVVSTSGRLMRPQQWYTGEWLRHYARG